MLDMSSEEESIAIRLLGEMERVEDEVLEAGEAGTSVDTFAGRVQVKFAPDAAVSTLGLMTFFIEFLKTSGLFEGLVEDCPLR